MPRRRGPKTRPVDRKSKKSNTSTRWNNREDIPLDEVDEFHEQRDKILLDGNEAAQDTDEEEEVFALKGLDESSEDEDEYEDDELEDEETPKSGKKTKASQPDKTSKSKKKSKNKKAEESSEDESEEEDEEEESWGRKKSVYYSSNAAQLDSGDEEAHEMEEQEARRIQAKLREPMREEDFGFADAQQVALQTNTNGDDDFWTPVAKPPPAPEGTDKMSILRHMEKTCPETLALAQDWEDVAQSVVKTEQKLAEIERTGTDEKSLGLLHVYHQAQLAYAALLAFYLHLRTSERYVSRPDLLRQHPILKRLLILKQSLRTLEDLGFSLSDSEDETDSEDNFDSEDSVPNDMEKWLFARKLGLDIGELEDLLNDASASDEKSSPPVNGVKSKSARKTDKPPKKKRKVAGDASGPEVVFDVEEPTLPKSKGKSKGKVQQAAETARSAATDAYGEATGLDAADAADKGGRRRALRFHTSKIASASARRSNARNALGGDEDIPYRERKKQAEMRNKLTNPGVGGDDLDDEEPDAPRQAKRARTEDDDENEDSAGEGDDDDGYYSLIKRQKKDKKAQKQVEYEAQKEAFRGMQFNDDTVEGQRSVTRAILANKGLTPKRAKSVRNPRVKKRQKFDKAKKKLASQKAVYKGGLSETGGYYGGEKSGISKVVKSVKL